MFSTYWNNDNMKFNRNVDGFDHWIFETFPGVKHCVPPTFMIDRIEKVISGYFAKDPKVMAVFTDVKPDPGFYETPGSWYATFSKECEMLKEISIKSFNRWQKATAEEKAKMEHPSGPYDEYYTRALSEIPNPAAHELTSFEILELLGGSAMAKDSYSIDRYSITEVKFNRFFDELVRLINERMKYESSCKYDTHNSVKESLGYFFHPGNMRLAFYEQGIEKFKKTFLQLQAEGIWTLDDLKKMIQFDFEKEGCDPDNLRVMLGKEPDQHDINYHCKIEIEALSDMADFVREQKFPIKIGPFKQRTEDMEFRSVMDEPHLFLSIRLNAYTNPKDVLEDIDYLFDEKVELDKIEMIHGYLVRMAKLSDKEAKSKLLTAYIEKHNKLEDKLMEDIPGMLHFVAYRAYCLSEDVKNDVEEFKDILQNLGHPERKLNKQILDFLRTDFKLNEEVKPELLFAAGLEHAPQQAAQAARAALRFNAKM